jgi:hypothetical protein
MAQAASRRRANQPASDPNPDPQDDQQLESDEEASEPSLTGSSAATSFISEPGPEFDPEQAQQDAAARDGDRAFAVSPGGETGINIEWHPDTIKAILTAKGSALHSVLGKSDQDWIYTRDELGAIAPALTRILNRYDATRVAASSGDELAVILGLSGYTMRSLGERKAALDAGRQDQDEPPLDPLASGLQPPPFDPTGSAGEPIQ